LNIFAEAVAPRGRPEGSTDGTFVIILARLSRSNAFFKVGFEYPSASLEYFICCPWLKKTLPAVQWF